MPTLLETITERRAQRDAARDAALAIAQGDDFDPENASYRSLVDQSQRLNRDVTELVDRAEELRAAHDVDSRILSIGSPPAQTRSTASGSVSEPSPWRTAGEYMRDLVGSFENPLNQSQVDVRAAERIAHHRQIEAERRAVQTTADSAGLLPTNIIGEVVTDVDGMRPFVAALGARPLNNVTGKTFNRPIVTQHSDAGEQATENTALVSQKMIVGGIPFAKKTVGGFVEITRQDIDWTDPSAWQLLLDDLAGVYAEESEDVAVTAFSTAVTQTTEMPSNDLAGIVAGLYDAAYKALTKAGTVRARTPRLPTAVFTSADQWKVVGSAIDIARAQVNPVATGLGSGGVGTVNGTVLDLPRIMVPGLPVATIIVGSTRYTEFYEQRVGVIQAVKPSTFGVEVAYGGYIAYGTLDPTAFCKVTAFNP